MWNHVRLLIVDDTTDDRVLNTRIALRELPGATVSEVASGDEALEFLAANRVDLVMTDDRMLGMDGATLVKKIREKDAAIPILVVSLDLRAQERVLAAGASAFVNKMDATAIMQSIRTLLASRAAPPSAEFGQTAGQPETQH